MACLACDYLQGFPQNSQGSPCLPLCWCIVEMLTKSLCLAETMGLVSSAQHLIVVGARNQDSCHISALLIAFCIFRRGYRSAQFGLHSLYPGTSVVFAVWPRAQQQHMQLLTFGCHCRLNAHSRICILAKPSGKHVHSKICEVLPSTLC